MGKYIHFPKPPKPRKKSKKYKKQKKRTRANKRAKIARDFKIYANYGYKRRSIKKFSDAALQIKRIIYLCGGAHKICQCFDPPLERTTPHQWVIRESIPWRHLEILSILMKRKISVGDLAEILNAIEHKKNPITFGK